MHYTFLQPLTFSSIFPVAVAVEAAVPALISMANISMANDVPSCPQNQMAVPHWGWQLWRLTILLMVLTGHLKFYHSQLSKKKKSFTTFIDSPIAHG